MPRYSMIIYWLSPNGSPSEDNLFHTTFGGKEIGIVPSTMLLLCRSLIRRHTLYLNSSYYNAHD